MTPKHIPSKRQWVTLAAVVAVLGLVAIWPVAAQQRSRRTLATAPTRMLAGDQISMSCLNAGNRPIGMRFHVVDADSGMPVATSMDQVVPPGRAGFFDVFTVAEGEEGLRTQSVFCVATRRSEPRLGRDVWPLRRCAKNGLDETASGCGVMGIE